MILIRPIQKTDCREIANLHISCLNSRFDDRPGLEMLRLYYEALSTKAGACGYVAEQAGKLLGYVCGIWDPKRLKRALVKQAFFPLIFWAICHFINKPSAIGSLIARASQTGSAIPMEGYELRPIVVSPAARGSGAAQLLVERLEQDAQERGFQQIHLITEIDNIAAQKFYQKTGFLRSDTTNQSKNLYFLYIKPFTHSP